MTAAAKIKSLAPALRKRAKRRGHHKVDHSAEAEAVLKRFAAGVRARRAGRPLRVVAGEVGISVQQLSNIECGNSWPSMPVYLKLCQVLRIALPEALK